MLDRLFTNAVLVSHEGRVCANIGTKDGKVAFVGTETPEARQTVDVGGKIVIPGCIDSHLHFQDPGYTDREDLDHGSAACAAAQRRRRGRMRFMAGIIDERHRSPQDARRTRISR